jgi:hypothetical protein
MVEGRPVSNKATLFSPLQCSTPAMLAVRIEQLRARSDHLSEATHPSEMEEASLVKQ